MELTKDQLRVEKFYRKRPKMILKGDAGSGKTIAAINVANKHGKRVLIVCPKGLMEEWQEALAEFNNEIERIRFDYKIVNYEKIRQTKHKLAVKEYKADFLICDEAHTLRNWKAAVTRNMWHVARYKTTKSALFLTATPILKSPLDAFYLLKLCGGYKYSRRDFILAYMYYEILEQYTPRGMIEILQEISVKYPKAVKKLFKEVTCIIKRDDVDIRYKEHYFTPLREYSIDFEKYSRERAALGKDKTLVALDKLEELCNHYKKVIIFFHHKEVGEAIMKRVGAALIVGGNTAKANFQVTQRFEKSPKARLAMTINCGGVGFNLNSAEAVIFFENSFTYAQDYQALMRGYRLGKKFHLDVHYLLFKNEHPFELCQKRKSVWELIR